MISLYSKLIHACAVTIKGLPKVTGQSGMSITIVSAKCNALFIYLIILVEFKVFYMTYMIYVDK